jgi:dienelactone hydrolase
VLSMARSGQFECGVDFYHSLFPDHRELEQIKGKLQCHFGTADTSTPKREVEAFRETLERYEKDFEIVLWEGMPHSFINLEGAHPPEQESAVEACLAQAYEFLHAELGR